MANKVKITIEGIVREVDAGTNVLQTVLDQGLVIPHFCYHEALGAVGACRLCACQIAPAADKPARLEMSCMVRATEGMVVSVNDPYAKNFRKQVIEDLMLNHPHDCPVCDEGGECMLQDMTVLSEHQHRRTRFTKRTWRNQDLGPLVHHEMNRCITCYRCTRYYREYALGDDLGVFGSRDRVYFGRVEDGTLESEFSGNLLDVCPTGVFTNKRFRENYTRPWDLQTSRSVCASCSAGCNVLPGYRHNTLRRIKPIGNPAVNKFFMCDRGRFGGEYVNHADRLLQARDAGVDMSLEDAMNSAANRLEEIRVKHGGGALAGFGSDRATMEANAALSLLLKGLGSQRVAFFGSTQERGAVRRAAAITASGDVRIASLPDMETADFVLVLGGDLTAESPMMDLSIRQSIKNGNPLFIVSPRAGSLDKFALGTLRTVPGEEAHIASFIGSVAADQEAEEGNFIHQVAKALQEAKKPLILASTLHEDAGLVEAAFGLTRSASTGGRTCSLAYFYPAGNSVGAGLIKHDEDPATLIADVSSGKIKALVVLERDISRLFASPEAFKTAAAKLELLVVIDCISSATSEAAHILIPSVSHYQAFGTLVNYEGRGQRFDGMQWASPIVLAASEVLVTLVQRAGLEESIGGTEFHDVYDVTRESSRHLDGLHVGDSGTIVRCAPRLPPATKDVPPNGAAEGKLQRWDVIHTFGSEELSALSPPIAELAPAPYIEMHPEDAAARKFTEGKPADLNKEFGVSAPLRVNASLAKGTVAIPVLRTRATTASAVPVEAAS